MYFLMVRLKKAIQSQVFTIISNDLSVNTVQSAERIIVTYYNCNNPCIVLHSFPFNCDHVCSLYHKVLPPPAINHNNRGMEQE